MKPRLIHVNGKLVPESDACLSPLDRGFTLGDGAFDTMRAVGGRVFRLEHHLARLDVSARVLGLQLPASSEILSAAIAELLSANGVTDALIRVTVSRGVPSERGVLPANSATPTITIALTPFTGYPEVAYERGYRATISTIRRNETSPLSRIKSCNYLDSVLARVEAARRDADEAILLNTAGNLACGSTSNLFLVLDGCLVTPSLESGVLPGVTRGTTLDAAGALHISTAERTVSISELRRSEEAFVTNTAFGIMPIVAVDGLPVGSGAPGEICRSLKNVYLSLLIEA